MANSSIISVYFVFGESAELICKTYIVHKRAHTNASQRMPINAMRTRTQVAAMAMTRKSLMSLPVKGPSPNSICARVLNTTVLLLNANNK